MTHTTPTPIPRPLLRLAYFCCIVFRLRHYPLVATAILLNFTFLQHLPSSLRIMVLMKVALYTILFPYLVSALFNRLTASTVIVRHPKARRQMHHFITYLGFVLCVYMVQRMRLPFHVVAYLEVAITCQMVCLVVGTFWHLSSQCAAATSVVGFIASYSLMMEHDALRWICLAILLSGVVATSRVVMRKHSVAQAVGGSVVGLVCAVIILFIL